MTDMGESDLPAISFPLALASSSQQRRSPDVIEFYERSSQARTERGNR